MLILFAVLSLFTTDRQAYAFDSHAIDGSYEDAAEFLREIPVTEAHIEGNLTPEAYPAIEPASLKKINSNGTWAFKFVLVRKDGTEQIISEYRADRTMKPASTLKLFTGWMGFTKKVKSESFLTFMLQTSNNPDAQKTLKAVGGLTKLRNFYVEQIPVKAGDLTIFDGSGFAHENRVSIDLEIDLLRLIKNQPEYDTFKTYLAQPGRAGTLRNRLSTLKEPLYGKTGTLWDTIGLAGFVELSEGTLLFSMISNQLRPDMIKTKKGPYNLTSNRTRKLIDRVVQEHVSYIQGRTLEAETEGEPALDSPPEDEEVILPEHYSTEIDEEFQINP